MNMFSVIQIHYYNSQSLDQTLEENIALQNCQVMLNQMYNFKVLHNKCVTQYIDNIGV